MKENWKVKILLGWSNYKHRWEGNIKMGLKDIGFRIGSSGGAL
jgi:hypothetical protein